MANSIQGLPPKAQPWARGVEGDLKRISRALGIVRNSVSQMPDLDRTVFSEFSTGQTLSAGTNGKVTPTTPVNVRFSSGTGLFEVTVSLAGLVRDGAIFGASFESEEEPYEASYDLPKYGVVHSAPQGQTAWSPFAGSYSTVVSSRPGVQNLSLYLYGVCTFSVNSSAYLKRARLSVKAV